LKHDPPVGPVPVVHETGKQSNAAYDRAVSAADNVLYSIVKGVNQALPGGGGYHYDVGQGALNAPVNGGQSLAPVENLYKGGLLPTGVVPGVGFTGSTEKCQPKCNDRPQAKPAAAKPQRRTVHIRGRPAILD
jgi:hypothetical protein